MTKVKCEDVKGKFYISSTDQTKGCGWVQYKTVFRCELEEVKENCRKTCGLCDEINSESPPYDSQDPDISYGTQSTSSPSKNIQGNPLAPGKILTKNGHINAKINLFYLP